MKCTNKYSSGRRWNFIKRLSNLFSNNGVVVSIAIVILLLFTSIGYSAMATSFLVSGDAHLRVKADIRITDIKMIGTSNAGYETYNPEYYKDGTKIFTTLPNIDSTVTYQVEVTNTSDLVYALEKIEEIINSNENIEYVISNIKEKDEIAANSKVTFNITVKYKEGISEVPSNNLSTIELNYVFEIPDHIPPEVMFSLQEGTYSIGKTVTITASDLGGSGYDYMSVEVYNSEGKVESKSNSRVTAVSYRVTLDSESIWTIYVKAYDKAGNKQITEPLNEEGYTYRAYKIEEDKSLYTQIKDKAVSDSTSSEFVTSPNGIDFKYESSDINGKGLYLKSGTENNEYPIYYYRGEVTDNNVIFGGFCWKIVRTTETGGTKLIYNGVPSDGVCDNTGADTHIETKAYSYDSYFSAVGYMYGDEDGYESLEVDFMHIPKYLSTDTINLKTTNYIYADSVVYNSTTKMYTLVDGKNSSSNFGNKYTCFSETESSCSTVKYIVYSASSYYYCRYVELTNGDTIEKLENYEVVYGKSVTYDNQTGMYTLVNTKTSALKDWDVDYATILGENGYYYTCFTNENTCSDVAYIYRFDDEYNDVYYVVLVDGKMPNDVLDTLLSEDNDKRNQNDSLVKFWVDKWYGDNMTSYTEKLEDIPWCNDRSLYREDAWDFENSGPINRILLFGAFERMYKSYNPSLTCPNKLDSFTVSSNNGNGKLTYPVGLLTIDEAKMAGYGFQYEDEESGEFVEGSPSYLNNGKDWWTLTPFSSSPYEGMFVVFNDVFKNFNVDIDDYLASPDSYYYYDISSDVSSNQYDCGIRPSISLKNNVEIVSGDGSINSPYILN